MTLSINSLNFNGRNYWYHEYDNYCDVHIEKCLMIKLLHGPDR